jgi:hypothetical protein
MLVAFTKRNTRLEDLMQKVLVCLITTAALMATAAWAQEGVYEGGRTEREATEATRGVYESPLTISPQVGVFGFADGTNSYTSRVVEGFTLDLNVMPFMRTAHAGIRSGLLFSHIGAAGSNFFGANSPDGNNAGANTFLIPIELFANGRVAEKVVAGLQFGTTAVYRSISTSMNTGRAVDTSAASSTEFFPSLGLNVGWEVSKSVAVALRGDYMITPGSDMFTTSLGATFPIA